MDGILWYLMFGFLILPWIIYFTVRAAVKEGAFEALVEFEEHKNRKIDK